jgi:23S rRNA pseudouridine1911/1915/1917 synthase
MSLTVLYEDNHLLVVDKPAGLPTMGVAEGKPSLLTTAREYIRRAYDKPGNVYLGIVSRLDAPVTGVVTMARTSKAASRLTESFRSHKINKVYLALVEGESDLPAGDIVHYLRHDERNRRVHVTHPQAEGAKQAVLACRILGRCQGTSLCEIVLKTGRKHQIRVQLSKLGHPIIGDRKYGSELPFAQGIALHAWKIELEHPVRREPMRIVAPLPRYWPEQARRAVETLE